MFKKLCGEKQVTFYFINTKFHYFVCSLFYLSNRCNTNQHRLLYRKSIQTLDNRRYLTSHDLLHYTLIIEFRTRRFERSCCPF